MLNRIKLRELVHDAFAQDGWLVSQGRNHIPEQYEYAQSMADWLCSGADKPFGFLEGETGTGKSLGYLIPLLSYAALTNERVAISTYTIHLQRQLLKADGDVELAQRFLSSQNLPVPAVAQFLGRQNYVSIRAMESHLLSLSDRDNWPKRWKTIFEAAEDLTLRGTGRIADLVEMFGELPADWSLSHLCIQADQEDIDNAAFLEDRAAAKIAPVCITSHAAMLTNALLQRHLIEGIDEAITAIVFDEADLIEKAASNIQKRIPFSSLKNKLELSLEHIPSVAYRRHVQAASESLATLSEVSFNGQHFQSVEKTPTVKSALEVLAQSAKKMLPLLDKYIGEDGYNLRGELSLLASKLQSKNEASQTQAIAGIYFSEIQHRPGIMFYVSNPESILTRAYHYFTQEAPAKLLFTSATLSNARDRKDMFSYFRGNMMIPESKVCVQRRFEPTQFGSIEYVISQNDTKPFERCEGEIRLTPDFIADTAKMIEAAATIGPTLVLVSSFDEGARLAKKLKTERVVLHESGEGFSRYASSFAQGANVLISPAAWEGVSLRLQDGTQAFTQLVVTRLPFTPPDRADEEAFVAATSRNNRITEEYAVSFYRAKLALAARRKLRQGFGRALRSATDVATIWICDPRFPKNDGSRATAPQMLEAIPSRFMQKWKEADFFKNGQRISTTELSRQSTTGRLFG